MEKIRLTQTVQKGGCAAKVAAQELHRILEHVKFPKAHANLLIDGRHFDDAAVYKISDTQSLVQTIDFFTPIVDDPYRFGQISACNSISDVYAMGGRPITALAVLAFPLTTLPSELIAEVLQGASDMVGRANANFVGGHSIDDDTLKFGLSVTGLVANNQIWSNQGAREGDRLILTKALGTGTMTAALKRQVVTEDEIRDAIESMSELNNVIDYLSPLELSSIHSATDITGFGLSGHALQMARASNKSFIFDCSQIPYFHLVPEFLQKDFLTKAHRSNQKYTAESLNVVHLKSWQQMLIHDPQTSGGLLLSVAANQADKILNSLKSQFPWVAEIGEVVAADPTPQLTFQA